MIINKKQIINKTLYHYMTDGYGKCNNYYKRNSKNNNKQYNNM